MKVINGRKGRMTYLGVGLFVMALVVVSLLFAEFSLKIGFFAVTPSPSAVVSSQNAVFSAFGNASAKQYAGVANPLLSGAPVGNFVVISPATITNGTNTSYVSGSAVNGIARMVLNGSVVNGNVYTADVQFVVNGSTDLTLPIEAVDNGSLSTTLFQITSVEVIGLGTQASFASTVHPSTQPTTSTLADYDLGVLPGRGTYMLEISVSPTSTKASGNPLVNYNLYELGGSTGAAALTGGVNGRPQLSNFQVQWKNRN